jgi:hypothetical protein
MGQVLFKSHTYVQHIHPLRVNGGWVMGSLLAAKYTLA